MSDTSPSVAGRVPNAVPSPAARASTARTALAHAAIGHAADGVRFVALGRSRAAVLAQLGAYVGRNAGERLWPAAARSVRRLLRAGAVDAAVAAYFAAVGARWDEEWLTHCRAALPARPTRAGKGCEKGIPLAAWIPPSQTDSARTTDCGR